MSESGESEGNEICLVDDDPSVLRSIFMKPFDDEKFIAAVRDALARS